MPGAVALWAVGQAVAAGVTSLAALQAIYIASLMVASVVVGYATSPCLGHLSSGCIDTLENGGAHPCP